MNAVAPGLTRTPATTEDLPPEDLAGVLERQAMKREVRPARSPGRRFASTGAW